MKPVELAPDYYHKNFLELTGYVCKQYWDLLSEQERSFAQRFHKLSPHAQKLYVRLISRKGPYFRSSKLAYPEIPSLEAAALELERARLLSMNPAISTASLLALLNKQEVLKLKEIKVDLLILEVVGQTQVTLVN